MRIGRHVPFALACACLAGLPAALAQTYDANGRAFSTPASYTVGDAPYAVVVADPNTDGILDLVVANENSDSVSLLLGTGGGKFAAPLDFATGDGPHGIVVADINANGLPDLVVADFNAGSMSVRLGNGGGGFATAVPYPTLAFPHAVVVGDFNGDNKPDLVTAGGGGVALLANQGGGVFAAPAAFVSGVNPRDVKAADVNADNKLDLVVSNQGGNDVSILLGTGTGSFLSATHYPVGTDPWFIAVGDVNGDGKPDIAAPSTVDNKVSILLGAGDGTFVAAPDVALQSPGIAVALADVDADGKADLLVARGSQRSVGVFRSLGNGSFGPVSNTLGGDSVESLVVADVSADGKPDLVGVSPTADNVAVSLLETPQAVPIAASSSIDRTTSYARRKAAIWIDRQTPGSYAHAAYGDIDHDGDADYLRAIDVPDQLAPAQVWINNGNGSFSDQTATRMVGTQPGIQIARKVLSGDYNADGWADFFVLTHGLDEPPFPGEVPKLFLSNGNGTLHHQADFLAEAGFFHGGASADFDGNGTEDILLGGAHPFLMLNDGDGTWTRNRSRLPIRADGSVVVFDIIEAIDIEGDGFVDLVCQEPVGAGRIRSIYWGAADGLYRDWRRTSLPQAAGYLDALDFAAEDIDRDGRRDVVVNWSSATDKRYLQVLRQASARTFVDETATRMAMDTTLRTMDYIRMQDINGDGHVDVFIDDKHDLETGEYAWTNNGNGVFAPYAGAVAPAAPVRITVDDASRVETNGITVMSFTVRLSRTSPLPVYFDIATADGSATAGSDYTALVAASQSVPAGQLSQTYNVTIQGDSAAEADETFYFDLSRPIGGTLEDARAAGVVVDDDARTLSINDVSVNEGDSGTKLMTFTVTLSQAATVPVAFNVTTVDGNAVGGADYAAQSSVAQSIPAGQLSKLVSIAIQGETVVEPLEYFYVDLANVSGAVPLDTQGIGYIINNDGALISINDVAVGEGNAGTKQMTFTVSLSQAAPGPVSYNFYTQAGGDATAGVDYVAASLNSQVIPQGQLSRTHTVTINGDTTIEPTEVLLAYVRQPVGASVWDGQGTGYILNDDGPTLSVPDASVGEGNSGAKLMNVTVLLSQASANPVTFAISSQNVSATAGSDYTALNLTNQVIPAGQTSKVFQIPVAGDTTVEQNETFLVTLAPSPVGATLYDRQAIATIYNDDGPTLSVNDVTVTEGNAGTKVATFTVSLSQTAAAPVTYNIATSNLTATAGSDYVARSLANESIPAGQTSKTFTVTLNGDVMVEANETFRVTLSNISSNVTLFKFTGTGTIGNDD